MDYDVDTFNGEVTPKLSVPYKIPLKPTPPKGQRQTNENGTAAVDPALKEVFSSPLLPFYSIESSPNEFDELDSRKRKLLLPPPPPPPPAPTETCNFSTTLKKIFGRDPSYPDGLNELIQPLCCNLCNVRHNSMRTATVHYESKNHDKKITNWLNEWARQTGEPLPKVQKLMKDGITGPAAYHCEACDLALTSLQHASQHYNGKKHKMVVANVASPSGSGYYDQSGKWIRTPTKIKTDSRYGIGESFIEKPLEENSTKVAAPQKVEKSTHCDLCNISVTSDQQMEMHLKGSKHNKKLKALGKPPYSTADDTVLASVQATPKNDLSMYRTPTGNYYCKSCNLMLSDPSDLTQHLNSKKHNKNLKKPIQDVTATAKSDK